MSVLRFEILKELIQVDEIQERCNKAKTWNEVYAILVEEARKRGIRVQNVHGRPVVG